MRKTLPIALLAIIAIIVACSQARREWNATERAEFRQMVDDYRTMVYLNDLSDAEFVIFSDDVAEEVELSYPTYTTLVALPSLNDSVDMWVVTTIVDDIDEDAHNIRHIYPYRTLVAQGILPSGVDHAGKKAFYNCLASKINNYFSSTEAFFYAIISNNIDPNIITKMQNECANDLFDWVVEVDEVEVE